MHWKIEGPELREIIVCSQMLRYSNCYNIALPASLFRQNVK